MRLLRNVELSTLSNINLPPFFVIALNRSITLFLVGLKEFIFAIPYSSVPQEFPKHYFKFGSFAFVCSHIFMALFLCQMVH